MNYKGRRLEFISRINRDGSGVVDEKELDLNYLDDETLELQVLSLTKKTYIAFGFNVYIVNIKRITNL